MTQARRKWAHGIPEGYVDTHELQERLGKSATSIWRMILDGRLPKPFKDGKKNVWDKREIDRWFTEIGDTPVIVDLKTCSDLDSFEFDAKRFMYGIQFAFYRHILLRSVFDEYEIDCMVPAKVYAVAVEKREPFRCGVFEVSDFTLEQFTERILIAIAALGNCQKTGEYPTLYESLRTLNLF